MRDKLPLPTLRRYKRLSAGVERIMDINNILRERTVEVRNKINVNNFKILGVRWNSRNRSGC
jgi:hypothetical protein